MLNPTIGKILFKSIIHELASPICLEIDDLFFVLILYNSDECLKINQALQIYIQKINKQISNGIVIETDETICSTNQCLVHWSAQVHMNELSWNRPWCLVWISHMRGLKHGL